MKDIEEISLSDIIILIIKRKIFFVIILLPILIYSLYFAYQERKKIITKGYHYKTFFNIATIPASGGVIEPIEFVVERLQYIEIPKVINEYKAKNQELSFSIDANKIAGTNIVVLNSISLTEQPELISEAHKLTLKPLIEHHKNLINNYYLISKVTPKEEALSSKIELLAQKQSEMVIMNQGKRPSFILLTGLVSGFILSILGIFLWEFALSIFYKMKKTN